MKPSLIFFIDYKKANKKIDKIPLVARILFKREKVERQVDKVPSAATQLWDSFKQEFTGKESHSLNFAKNKFEYRFKKIELDNWDKLYHLSAKDILNAIDAIDQPIQIQQKICVLQYIEDYYSQKVINNKNYPLGTKKNYRKSINHLIYFLEWKKLKNITLDEFTNALGKQFYEYLINDNDAICKQSIQPHSAAAIISKLRVVFSELESNKLISNNPMKAMKLTKKYPQKPRLDIYQITAIKNLDLTNSKPLDLCRKLFLFFFYIGQSYGDMMQLKKTNLKKYGDNWFLEGKRNKTNEQYKVYLHKYAKALLDEFDAMQETQITGLLIPQRAMAYLNRDLKIIAAKCNIDFTLSTNIARHTFRQLASEAGIYDIAVIKKMMGHTPINDIDSNYFMATESKLIEAKNKYENYLERHFEKTNNN